MEAIKNVADKLTGSSTQESGTDAGATVSVPY